LPVEEIARTHEQYTSRVTGAPTVATHRVRYRIDEDKHAVIVLDIVARADASHPGRARAQRVTTP
jgi:hypothetical protein